MSNIIRHWLDKEFELTFYYSCLLSVFVLYFAGLFNVLEPTVWVLKIIGLCGFLLFLNKKIRNEFNITYGFIFIISSILFLYWNVNTVNYAYYSGVDDYAHWGRMMSQITNRNKLIELNDAFATGQSKDYPPAIALFQYIFSYFTGYQRNIGTFGQGFLTISVLSVLFLSLRQKYDQKNGLLFIALTLFIGSMVWIFGSGFHSLQADLLLGSSMGVSLFIYYFYKKEGVFQAILLATPAILSLVLIKHIGILFAGFSLLIIAADIYAANKKHIFRGLIFIFGILILLLILRYTWTSHVLNLGMTLSHSPRVTSIIEVIKAFIPGYATEFQSAVIQNYFHYLFMSHHSSTYWFIASIILMLASLKIAKNNAFEVPKLIYTFSYLCFVGYLLVLLILYLFSFSESEGLIVASATRYIKTMSLAMLIFFAGILVMLLDKAKLNLANKIIVVLTLLLLILPNLGRILNDTYASFMNRPTQMEAYEREKMAEYTISKTPQNAKIYFIWVDSSRDSSVFFNYAIYPRQSNQDCTSIKPIGSLKTKDDPNPCYLTPEQFENTISAYDFVYFASTSEEFKQNYFVNLNKQDEPKGLFEIQKNGSKLILQKK